uniref:Wax synthase domain-containing protein n=1 Tax=Oryza punctata TaxID=4537 RepID=A0A0E0KRZ8_ORYPU
MAGGDLRSLVAVCAAVTAAMWYVRFAARRLRPGLPRLAAFVPVLAVLPFLPLAFSALHPRSISGFFLAWLAEFKLLLLASGQGPLDPSLPLPAFLAIATFPVRQGDPTKKTTGTGLGPVTSAVMAALLAAIVSLYRYRERMNPYALLVLYSLHVYLALELVLACAAAAVRAVMGMDLEPQFDQPYLSAHLRDFWGRRWNLSVPAVLRPCVSRPVRELIGGGGAAAVAAGVLAAFFVSGVMHELMFYYITLRPPTGEAAAFFTLHGVLAVAEGWWAARKGWPRPPRPVATALTLALVMSTGFWLFFPPITRPGADKVAIAESEAVVAFVRDAGSWAAASVRNSPSRANILLSARAIDRSPGMAGGDLRSLVAVAATVAASMSYVRFAARRLRPGLHRLVTFVPVLAILPVLPLAFRALHLRATSGFFLGWLAEFKLLLLASGHGPLDPSLPLPAFVAIASLPVRRRQLDSKNAPRSGLGLVTSAVMAALLAAIVSLYRHKERMNKYVLLMLYSLHVYLALELVLAFTAAAARAVMRMDLEPQFDRPYLSASLREFWGRRWNLSVPALLRQCVSRPVRARVGGGVGGVLAGVLAAFFVSGIMHEAMIYYATLRPPTGEATAFFALHGACAVAEGWCAAHKGWPRPPRAVATTLTLAFILATGFWLIVPPITRTGSDMVVIAESEAIVAFVRDAGSWAAATVRSALTGRS